MPSSKGKPVSIDGRCALSLTWLSDRLGDAEREDVVTLAFQVWLLGLSLVAVSVLRILLRYTGLTYSGFSDPQ